MQSILYKLFFSLPRLSFELAGRDYFIAFGLYQRLISLMVLWKWGIKRRQNFMFVFNKYTFSLCLLDSTDVAALEEIYVKKEYNWQLPFIPEIILDLGANYGDTAIYYHCIYPEAKIFAVEASPESYARLCAHVVDIPNIIPIHAAVTDFEGTTELYIMKGSALGHSLKKRYSEMESVSVPACTLDTLSKKYLDGRKFDVIKFDIEGAEEKLFTLGTPEQFARAYIGELHYDLMSMSPVAVEGLFRNFKVETQKLNNINRVIIHAISK